MVWKSIGDVDVKADWCQAGEGLQCQLKARHPGGAISGSGQGVTHVGQVILCPGS